MAMYIVFEVHLCEPENEKSAIFLIFSEKHLFSGHDAKGKRSEGKWIGPGEFILFRGKICICNQGRIKEYVWMRWLSGKNYN